MTIAPVAPSALRGRTLNAPPSRAQTIRTMLEQHHWLTDPQRSGNGGSTTGLLLTPHEPRCTLLAKDTIPPVYRRPICTCRYQHFAELGRLLEVMRVDRNRPLVDTAAGKCSIRALRWHIVERYLRCDRTPKTVQFVAGKAIGTVSKQLRDGSYRQTVTPLGKHQALVHADAATWDTVLAEHRRKRSATPTEMRVTVATWSPEVEPVKVTAGIAWVADHWSLKIEPELPAESMAA